MPYKLECAGSFSSADASETDIHRAFDEDRLRGEFIILTAPNGDYMQAGGEGDGPYALEHRTAATEEHLCAVEPCTKEQVREAFIAYLRGEESWRTGRQWKPLEQKTGCTGMLLLLLFAGTGCLLRFEC